MLDTLAQSTIASSWLKAKLALLKQRDFTRTMTTRHEWNEQRSGPQHVQWGRAGPQARTDNQLRNSSN
jgi:hypothetical protein